MDYSPHDLLPIKRPLDNVPDDMFFYENVVKHLAQDILRIMDNGTPIDLEKVKLLGTVVEEKLFENKVSLATNPLMVEFLQHKRLMDKGDKISEVEAKYKAPKDFPIKFSYSNTIHRTYLVNYYLATHNLLEYTLDKWLVADVRKLSAIAPSTIMFCADVINKKVSNVIIEGAMFNLSIDKAEAYNKARDKALDTFDSKYEMTFNTSSTTQLNQLFDYYDIETKNRTKTGLKQINREELERLSYDVKDILVDMEETHPAYNWWLNMQGIIQLLILDSNAKIINNNFIPAFKNCTVDGVLYGNINLFGAKTFRLTSNNPNMLNMPSNGNVFAKSIKQCLIAPEGYVIYAVDLNALEDRVIANLSGDLNKIALFVEGLDGHCLHATYYFKDELDKILPFLENETEREYSKRFYAEVEAGNKELKAIRQKSKPVTFGLSYGCGPAKVASALNAPLEVGEHIYNIYHNELYPDITKLRETIVNKVITEGKIHLGLGCMMTAKDANTSQRTLGNAVCQFWSILTLLSINKLHKMIDEAELQNDIYVVNTIYDSIYFVVKKDSTLIKWLNDAIIPLLTTDFIEEQLVKNEACGEIGLDWSDLHSVRNNASIEEIDNILERLNDSS